LESEKQRHLVLPEWKQQIGFSDHEIPNRFEEWQSRIHPDDLAHTLAAINAYREKMSPIDEVEFRLRHKAGSYRRIYQGFQSPLQSGIQLGQRLAPARGCPS
jgi:PAS domain-containing protein